MEKNDRSAGEGDYSMKELAKEKLAQEKAP